MKQHILQRLSSLPLRAHLLMMALLLALPAIVLIIQSGLTQRSEAIRKGFTAARRLTNGIDREQHNLSSNIEQLVTALEQIPEIEKHDAAATHVILFNILKKNPQYANIIISDSKGDVWASGLPMTASFSIRNSLAFRQAIATRQFSSGDFSIGKVTHEPSIGFGCPIIDDSGVLKGVIAASISFKQFNGLVGIDGLPQGSTYSIIDRNGTITDRNLDPEKYIGTRLREDIFLRMKNGPDKATFIDGDLTDDKRIISYCKMSLDHEQSPYLYIRTSFPLEKVMANARRALFTNIVILSSFLLAAVLSVIILGNILFVKRIERLQRAAQLLAAGDLPAGGCNDARGGEIGRLGEAFDEMACKLTARQATLRKSEQELSELNRTLTRRVEEETDRRITHERLLARHARLVAMGEMIGAIAHQWRQPLATLGATIQSIRMAWDHECLDQAFLTKAEQDAQKQLYYMSDTIEDFRNFFTPEKTAEDFDIREKIAEVINLVTPQFAHSGVSLQTVDRAEGIDVKVRGYQNEFKQSLLNLVSNAFDAIVDKASHGAECAGSTANSGLVTIETAVVDNMVVIEVIDNGCGIAPEHAGKVFDPYFTTKSGDKGTGIGLYMTKLIIEESMEGRLSFTSSPEGTRFRIELARDDSEIEVNHG